MQWYLLTSLPAGNAESGAAVVRHYLQRWRMEDFFRVLKSGCKVEYLAFRTADRLQRAIAINAVIAWRLLVMTLLGRHMPECAASLMFSDPELEFLLDYSREYGLATPDSLGLVAHLGGYRALQHDPEPGHLGASDCPQARSRRRYQALSGSLLSSFLFVATR